MRAFAELLGQFVVAVQVVYLALFVFACIAGAGAVLLARDGLRWYRRRAVRRDLHFVARSSAERGPMGPRRIK